MSVRMKAILGTAVNLVAGIFIIVLMLYLGGQIFPTMFGSNSIPTRIMYTTTQTIDNAFFFILIIALIIDLVASWMNPSIGKAIANFVMILGLGYANVQLNAFIVASGPIFTTMNAILPNTTHFLTINFRVVVMYFFLIISTIFNVRSKSHQLPAQDVYIPEQYNKETGYSMENSRMQVYKGQNVNLNVNDIGEGEHT